MPLPTPLGAPRVGKSEHPLSWMNIVECAYSKMLLHPVCDALVRRPTHRFHLFAGTLIYRRLRIATSQGRQVNALAVLLADMTGSHRQRYNSRFASRFAKACQPFRLGLESASSALTEVCIVFRHFLPGNRFGKFDFAVYCMGGCNAP